MTPNQAIAEIEARLAAGKISTTEALREAFFAGSLFLSDVTVECCKGLADDMPREEPGE